MPPRPLCLHHSTSLPYRFFGRSAELRMLDQALNGQEPSLVALVGPGGQGKTAIVQQWLDSIAAAGRRPEGVFLWSFYRGKDADLCLRELYAYAIGAQPASNISASYCVDHLLPILRSERWALVFDGVEVAQYETGPWFGRLLHPELGRLIEELASAPQPGVTVLTTRFPIPGLERRQHARVVSLDSLDAGSSRALLETLGVRGSAAELNEAGASCGYHAKAVELLGTYLRRFHQGEARRQVELPVPPPAAGASDEEQKVARVLAAYQEALPQEAQDIIALATAFREPPSEAGLLEYLASQPVQTLLHQTWNRDYLPFVQRPVAWLALQVEDLVKLRLLERVGRGKHLTHIPTPGASEQSATPSVNSTGDAEEVIDAHPLVRRAFEHRLGIAGRRQSAQTRAGFLRGRPDRRRAATLEEAREEVELFHAHCDAGLWNEADGTYLALDNPKHRFLAPAFERDLLLRFFPQGDWRRPPLWPGFGRFRSLAICFELLGQFEAALAAYPDRDAPLGGDALIALGRLAPLLTQEHAPPPWEALWQAYRAHALCLAGLTDQALLLARSLVPMDVYEWVHVFECLLRCGRLAALDLRSVLYRPPNAAEHRWADLARRRMHNYLRVNPSPPADLCAEYEFLVEEYDRAGMPYERALTRLGFSRRLMSLGQSAEADAVNAVALDLAGRYGMQVIEADAWMLKEDLARAQGKESTAGQAREQALRLRQAAGYLGPNRP